MSLTKYKAGGYTRLSLIESDEGIESVSIKNQKSLIREFAEKNGIELYDFYIDDGYSGGNFDRPDFKRLLNDLECGVINCVITKDLSRLGRDFIETNNYIYKYFPENGIRYIAILDNLDTENPNNGDDMVPFKTVVNDMYLKDTSRKIKSVRHDLMNKGLFVGSSVPYGYKRSEEDNRKFVIDDYAARVVRRIFDMKLEGIKPNMIARTLTEEGILPPSVYNEKKIKKTYTTNLWKASTVNHILSNEVYIGRLVQGKYERVSLKSKKKRLLPKEKWIIIDNCHPAIIDKSKFNQVNKKIPKALRDNTRTYKYEYLLKGLVVCADCGKTMIVRRAKYQGKEHKGEEYALYCCSTYARYRNNVCSMHYYREDALNELVLKETKLLLTKYSNDDELNNEFQKTLANDDLLEKYRNQLENSEKKLIDLDKAISELYKDKVSGIITADEFATIKEDLQNDRTKISKEIDDLKVMLYKTKDNIADIKAVKKMITNFLKVKNPTKQMFRDLISKITIDKDKKVKIYFKFNLNGE